jgi:hypothetical protein
MPVPLSDGMRLSYASAPRGEDPILTVELLNVAFPEPLRFVSGLPRDLNSWEGKLEGDAPVNPGELVTFRIVPFSFTFPGTEKGGATPAQLVVENASSEISDQLDLTIGNRSALIVNVRVFVPSERIVRPGDIMRGLRMRRVEAIPLEASGELTYEDAARQAFPLGTFNQAEYPAIFQGA